MTTAPTPTTTWETHARVTLTVRCDSFDWTEVLAPGYDEVGDHGNVVDACPPYTAGDAFLDLIRTAVTEAMRADEFTGVRVKADLAEARLEPVEPEEDPF